MSQKRAPVADRKRQRTPSGWTSVPAPHTGFTLKMITTSTPMSVRSDHDRSCGAAPHEPGESRLLRRCVGQHAARCWSTARFSGSPLVERSECIRSPSGCQYPPRAFGSTSSRRSWATVLDFLTRNTEPTISPSISAIQQRSSFGL